jgi:glucose dehydrogenase
MTSAPNWRRLADRSGLYFIGATTDRYMRAFTCSGHELWRKRIPHGQHPDELPPAP